MKYFRSFLIGLWGTALLAGCGDGVAKDRFSTTPRARADAADLRADSTRPVRRIFVTRADFDGPFGDVRGADATCARDDARPRGPGEYKALLTDGFTRVACLTADCAAGGAAEHADWVLRPDARFVTPDGLLIGVTDALGLFHLPLARPIAPDGRFAWTGLSERHTAIEDDALAPRAPLPRAVFCVEQ